MTYCAPEMTVSHTTAISSAQTHVAFGSGTSISVAIAVIWKQVLTLPSWETCSTMPWRPACQRSSATPASRMPITSAIHSARRSIATSVISAVPTSSLSASGSAIRPNVVTSPRERARCPSAASVSAAAANTAAAAGSGPASSPSSSTSISGTNAMRLSVRALGRLSGTVPPLPVRGCAHPSGALELEA